MRCHECGEHAVYAPASGGIRVGLCAEHLRERITEFSEEEAIAALHEAASE